MRSPESEEKRLREGVADVLVERGVQQEETRERAEAIKFTDVADFARRNSWYTREKGGWTGEELREQLQRSR